MEMLCNNSIQTGQDSVSERSLAFHITALFVTSPKRKIDETDSLKNITATTMTNCYCIELFSSCISLCSLVILSCFQTFLKSSFRIYSVRLRNNVFQCHLAELMLENRVKL